MQWKNAYKIQYIRDFFSNEFWEQRYLRYGSMSDFKAVGLRYPVGDAIAARNGKRVATTGRELEAEQWMPEVQRKSIVYEDRVLDLDGEKVIATKTKTAEQRMIEEIREGLSVKDVKKLSIGMKALAGKSPVKKKSPIKKKTWPENH